MEGTSLSHLVVDMPFGLSDISIVFDVVDFLSNKEELIEIFRPEASKLIVKKDFFPAPFKKAYLAAFEDLIISLIRKELMKHFNLNGEELLIITEPQFLKMLIGDDFFNPENYLSKEKDNK